jgi:AraC-like DNA-binding protein
MMKSILETWRYTNKRAEVVSIPPDGCIDLIVARPKNRKPYWFVSSLQNTVSIVELDADLDLSGYRLRPGVRIDISALSKAIHREASLIQAEEYLEDCCLMPSNLECVIAIMAQGVLSPGDAARELGTSSRTLERLFLRNFLPPPKFAFQLGYADQSHMTREFKRWFGLTPYKLKSDRALLQSILQPGLGTA